MHTTMLWTLRRVLDRDQMIADAADMAERRDGGGAVLQQAALEVGIGPGLGDDARAVVRADLGLVGLDDEIERLGVDVALLGQDGFERAHPQLHLAELGAVVVVIVVVVLLVAHASKFS